MNFCQQNLRQDFNLLAWKKEIVVYFRQIQNKRARITRHDLVHLELALSGVVDYAYEIVNENSNLKTQLLELVDSNGANHTKKCTSSLFENKPYQSERGNGSEKANQLEEDGRETFTHPDHTPETRRRRSNDIRASGNNCQIQLCDAEQSDQMRERSHPSLKAKRKHASHLEYQIFGGDHFDSNGEIQTVTTNNDFPKKSRTCDNEKNHMFYQMDMQSSNEYNLVLKMKTRPSAPAHHSSIGPSKGQVRCATSGHKVSAAESECPDLNIVGSCSQWQQSLETINSDERAQHSKEERGVSQFDKTKKTRKKKTTRKGRVCFRERLKQVTSLPDVNKSRNLTSKPLADSLDGGSYCSPILLDNEDNNHETKSGRSDMIPEQSNQNLEENSAKTNLMPKQNRQNIEENNSDDEINDACFECGMATSKDWSSVILCDFCDGEYHLNCVNLKEVPQEDWVCQKCQIEEKEFGQLVYDVTLRTSAKKGKSIQKIDSQDASKKDFHYTAALPLPLAFDELTIKGCSVIQNVFPYATLKRLTHGKIYSSTKSGRQTDCWGGARAEFISCFEKNGVNLVDRKGRYEMKLPAFVSEQLGLEKLLSPIFDYLKTVMSSNKSSNEPQIRSHNIVVVPKHHTSTQAWHCDDVPKKSLAMRHQSYFTVLIPLNPTSISCGGTELWNSDDEPGELIRPRPGDAFVFSGSLIHRGQKNTGNTERYFYYASYSKRVDANV